MEVRTYLFKPEQLPGDAPENRGTELGHAVVFLDALAYYSGNMSLPRAFIEGGRAMIHAHRDLSHPVHPGNPPLISSSMLEHARDAQEFADMQMHVWADSTQGKPLDTGNKSVQTLLLEYRTHVRGLSIAMQRILEPVNTTRSTKDIGLFPNMNIALMTILNGRRVQLHEPITVKRDIPYDRIQQIAAVQVAIWQVRIWEESVLYSFSRSLSEVRGLSWNRSDGGNLQVPLSILSGQQPGINYLSAESLSHPQYEPIIRYIQTHASMFDRRTTTPRRAIKRFQYALMYS